MIAIKQAKFKPSNKIQENQIKNITTTTATKSTTNKPSNVAQINTTTTTNTNTTSQQREQHLRHQLSHNHVISSKIDNHPCQARIARAQQDGPAVKSSAACDNNHKQHQQQQSNETRSETNERIDGASTASAAPTKSSPPPPASSLSASALAARPQPPRPIQPPTPQSSSSSSTATKSSLSTAAAVAQSAHTAGGASIVAGRARPQQQPQRQPQMAAASLTTASAKIQQRQQKFLAAAAAAGQQQIQQTACKRQTVLLSTPSKNDVPVGGVARSKVLSLATMMSGRGALLDRSSESSKAQGVDMSPQADIDQHRSTCFASFDATAASDSCKATATSFTATTNTAVVVDVGRVNRGLICCPSECNANDLAGANQQKVISPQDQREERQLGEINIAEDDNINIKNSTTTTRHNNHYHYHPYYNHNYLNFQRLEPQRNQPQQQQLHQQQQQQHQHQNYFHLQQYQQATNSPNQTAPQQQQQPVMAHYKFHNDCQSSVLTYEQVKRLDFVMDQTVPIHGRGGSPTLYVKLKELIRLVKHRLQNEHSIEIRDVRLNGGAASYVLAPENSKYNDLDLVFGTDLSDEDRFDVIRDVVLDCLMEFYPDKTQAEPRDQSAARNYESSIGVSGDTCEGGELRLACSIAPTGRDENEDEDSCEPPSRSNRSSSFESDNLNVTTNELDDDGSDEEDDVIVRIDSDDAGCQLDAKIETEEYGAREQPRTSDEIEDSRQRTVATDATGEAQANNMQAENPYLGYQYQSYNQMPPNNCAFKEAYVHKMVKVNDDDRWSLISLGVQQSETSGSHQLQQASMGGCQQTGSSAPATTDHHQQPQQRQQAHTSPIWCDNPGNQQKQFPNSIELKFVDRMRRKFEFSVDSFQIILDSLIQFYDYAPQSTITIQRTTPGAPPARPMIFNASPLAGIGQCLRCDHDQASRGIRSMAATSKDFSSESNIRGGKSKSVDQKKCAERNHCGTVTDSRSFYELPLEPGNSLSNSSVASSSGCSSSSSVVSSSSSSLSCDEDQEDLYCDVDNSPSSSASTSSLLSSTTTSGTGSPCDPLLESKPQKQVTPNSGQQEQQMHNQLEYRRQVICKQQCDRQTILNSDLSDTGGCQNLAQHHQSYQVPSRISNYKQHHVNTRSFSGGLGDHGAGRISSCAVISENFYPTVIGRSEYGNFKEALYHLEKKLIATRSPEEIRGGGLLKYCNLLVKNYKPTNVYQIRTLERYMCSRFFIDFSDLNQQRAKLESYLANHFSDDSKQKFDYLTILHNVVQRSTVCLMNHELKLTLNMIRSLAYNLPQQTQSPPLQLQQQQQPSPNPGQQNQQALVAPHQDHAPYPARQSLDKQNQIYQQQQQTTMQSGVYRVKLVNYALTKPIKS